MRNTIGDLVNELIPYTNLIEVTSIRGVPFLRAIIGAGNGVAKCYMYIIQTGENAYAICDHYDDTFGSRYFPLGSMEYPFVSEREIIGGWFKTGDDENHTYTNVMRNVTYTRFLEYLYDTLIAYKCTKFDPKNFKTRISSMGFTNERLKRIIDDEFAFKRRKGGTIHDLFDIVNRQHKLFNLSNARLRDIQCIVGKLRDIGITARYTSEGITHMELSPVYTTQGGI